MLAPVVQDDWGSPAQIPVVNIQALGQLFRIPPKEMPEVKSLNVLGGIIILTLVPAGIEAGKEKVLLGVEELDTVIWLRIKLGVLEI